MDTKRTVQGEIFIIAVCLTIIQCLFLIVKQIVFSFIDETLFSRSMVMLISMSAVFAVMLIYCRQKKIVFSVFPKTFSLIYILTTVLTAIFYCVTLFTVNGFSFQNALMLFYGSIVTPVFEELLFRGVIWNRLNLFFDKERKTYLSVTVLFALWHIGYAVGLFLWGDGNLIKIIAMKVLVGAGFGLITGAIRYKTENCYLCILVHGVMNAF